MRTLGRSGPLVSDIGLGSRGTSDLYGPADDTERIATIHAALDAGLTLLDTRISEKARRRLDEVLCEQRPQQ
jgi:aryl-alcohol dehydrogenase-like predicted oxidoreductase